MVGNNCRRHIYGMYCSALAYRYFTSNKRTYSVHKAKSLFKQGYFYVSEYAFYLRSDRQSMKAIPKRNIPKCLEYGDLHYVLDMINYEIFCENRKKEKSTNVSKNCKDP